MKCPNCGNKEVALDINKDELRAKLRCPACGNESEEFGVEPANDIAKKQSGFSA